MKTRIKSLLLLLIVFFNLAVVSSAAAENQKAYILLRPNNFVLPEGGGWTIQNDQDKYLYALPGGYLKDSAWQGPGASASFYVAEEGNYVVWAMTWDATSGFGTRYGYVALDGETDENKFQSTVPDGFTWSKTKKVYHLDKGMHSITLQTGYPSFCCSAVFITNDTEYVLNTETLYSSIENYADTEKPQFGGEIELTNSSQASFTAVFPEATDNISVASVKYYLNDAEIQLDENRTYAAANIKPLSKYTLKAVATDGLGNTAQVTKEIDLRKWSFTNCTLKNTAEEEIESLNDLIDTETKKDTAFTVSVEIEKLFSGAGKAQLFIGVFSQNGKKMEADYFSMGSVLATKNTVKKSKTFPVTEDFLKNKANYTVKVLLIDSTDNIMALTEGAVIENGGGAQ